MVMTPEERFQKIEEHLLVQAELVSRFERRVDAELVLHESRLDSHASELAQFRATVARVLELLERIVSGERGGTGFLGA